MEKSAAALVRRRGMPFIKRSQLSRLSHFFKNENIAISLFIRLPLLSVGQSAKEILRLANSASIENKHYLFKIPFEDKERYYIIPIIIGNRTYRYIFDTGGHNTITPRIQMDMGLSSLW